MTLTQCINVSIILVPSLSGDGTYSGSVSEQGGTVDLDPPLTASDGPICGYRLINKHKNKLPFQVRDETQKKCD